MSDVVAGALASSGELVNLGRVLQQDISSGLDASGGSADPTGASAAAPSSGADASDNGPDVPTCPTPWEIFNATAELSLWAEALQTVGFAGGPHTLSTRRRLQSDCKAFLPPALLLQDLTPVCCEERHGCSCG